jgi:hypothetical protein
MANGSSTAVVFIVILNLNSMSCLGMPELSGLETAFITQLLLISSDFAWEALNKLYYTTFLIICYSCKSLINQLYFFEVVLLTDRRLSLDDDREFV